MSEDRGFHDLIRRAGSHAQAAAELDAAFGQDRVVVVLQVGGVPHAVAHRGLPGVASAVWGVTEALVGVVKAAGGQVASRAPGHVVATFQDPIQAVTSALDAHRQGRGTGLQVAAAVGAGRILVAPGGTILGPVVEQGARMTFVAPDDVTVTDGTLAAQAIPVGVGVFRAPLHQEQAVGGAFHVLSDVR